MRFAWLIVLFLAALYGCPQPPPPPPPECPDGQTWNGTECVCPEGAEWVESEGKCLPLRVDYPPDLQRVVGITAFALALHPRDYITKVCEYIKTKGYNTLRVGFETWRWDGVLTFDALAEEGEIHFDTPRSRDGYDIGKTLSALGYLPKGPKFDSEENLSNVRRMLDATARVEGIWVELIPVFTIKGLGRNPDTPEMRRTAVRLAKQIVTEGDFKHVFFSYANEYKRSGSRGVEKITKGEVIHGLQKLSETGRLVTTDCFGTFEEEDHRWDASYERDFLPFVDAVAFHPRRNPEPTRWDLRLCMSRYVEREGKLACLFNETVSYASDAELKQFPWLKGSFLISNSGRPPQSKRRQIVTDYMGRVRKVGGIWYYHCISCFMGSRTFEPFWIPVWEN